MSDAGTPVAEVIDALVTRAIDTRLAQSTTFEGSRVRVMPRPEEGNGNGLVASIRVAWPRGEEQPERVVRYLGNLRHYSCEQTGMPGLYKVTRK